MMWPRPRQGRGIGCVICQIGDFVEAVNAGSVVPLAMFFR